MIWGGSSRRARSPLRRLALPVVVAAPSGWPSPSPPAARGSPPGLKRSRSRSGYRPPFLRLCGAPPRGRALRPSRVAVLGRARAVAASGSASPRLGPLRRAFARPPRSSGSLRAALRPCPSGRPRPAPGSCWSPCALVGLPAGCGRSGGPPLPRGACCGLAGGPLLPARGLSARCAGLGGLRSAPPRVGAPVLSSVPASIGRWIAARGVSPIRDNRSRPKQAGRRPGLDGGPLRGGGKLRQSRKLRTAVLQNGLDRLCLPCYAKSTDGASSVTRK